MGPTLSPETSAFKLQTPGKFPEEYKLHSEHGESLKTTILEGTVTHRLNSFIHQNHILPPKPFGFRKQHSTVNSQQSTVNMAESPTASSMALILSNTQAWSYLILRKYGLKAYSSGLSHVICRIIFFSSLSPTWKVVEKITPVEM